MPSPDNTTDLECKLPCWKQLQAIFKITSAFMSISSRTPKNFFTKKCSCVGFACLWNPPTGTIINAYFHNASFALNCSCKGSTIGITAGVGNFVIGCCQKIQLWQNVNYVKKMFRTPVRRPIPLYASVDMNVHSVGWFYMESPLRYWMQILPNTSVTQSFVKSAFHTSLQKISSIMLVFCGMLNFMISIIGKQKCQILTEKHFLLFSNLLGWHIMTLNVFLRGECRVSTQLW